jgi:hypothetical protein
MRAARGAGGIASRLSAFHLAPVAPVAPIRYRAFDTGPDLGVLHAPPAGSRRESVLSTNAESAHPVTPSIQPVFEAKVRATIAESPAMAAPAADVLLTTPLVSPVPTGKSLPDPVSSPTVAAGLGLSPPGIGIAQPVPRLQPGNQAPANASHGAPRRMEGPPVAIASLASPPPTSRPDYSSAAEKSPGGSEDADARSIASIRTRVIETVVRESPAPRPVPAASPAPAIKLPTTLHREPGVSSAPRAMGLAVEKAPSPALPRVLPHAPGAPGAPLDRLVQLPRVPARETVHIGSVQVQVRAVAPQNATAAAPAPVAARPASAPVRANFRNVWLSRRGVE